MSAASASYPSPSRSSAPGRKFSTRIGPDSQLAGNLQPAGRFQIEADRLLVPVVHREIARAGPQQPPGLVAANRLYPDDFGAQTGKDVAHRRAHDQGG